MKVCHYQLKDTPFNETRLGIQIKDTIIDPNLVLALHYQKNNFFNYQQRADHQCPSSLFHLLQTNDLPLEQLKHIHHLAETYIKSGDYQPIKLEQSTLNKPLDQIGTYRDFYAHEKHVAKGFEKRKEPVPEAWYEIPVYYKGATAGFIGPEEEILWPHYSKKLDYELEFAVIIGKDGQNITKENAYKHFFGFTILNDISARDIQKKEMSVRLGPSKGKDFCSIIGPVILTADEFTEDPNLKMTAKINGELWSEGMSGDSKYSFSEMLAFCSQDEWVLAGDLIGSGTVGTGCGLELDKWIQPGDVIELEIEKIGVLKNKVGPINKI